jgi:iron complex outermembrane receptor protein
LPKLLAGARGWPPADPCGRGCNLHRARVVHLALVAVAAAALADERLPEIVVTAPPVREEAPAPRDPTAFATVIAVPEAPTRIETLADALEDSVGVQVRRFGGLGDFSTVSIRGFSPGQVQVYLDGVPLSRADNETVDLSELPLDAVDHVEVYRSATPLAFAQSGPGGVVNVVTREPGEEPLAAASTSYGSFETRKADVAYGATHGAWSGLAFAHYLGSQGDFRFTDDRGTPDPRDDVTRTRTNDAFDQGDLTTRLVYRAAPLTLALTTDSFAKSQGVPGRTAPQSADAHRDTLRELGHVDLTLAPTAAVPVGVDASLFGVYQHRTFVAPPGDRAFVPTDVTNDSTSVGGQVVVRGTLGAHQVPSLLLAGSAERFVDHDGIGRFGLSLPGTSPPRTRARATIAGEDEILLLADRLSLVPGLRWEVFRDVFPGDPRIEVPALRVGGTTVRDFLTPRLGVRGDPGFWTTLLANVGRSARVPNLDELFGNGGVVKGSPTLRPEKATDWDAGFRARTPRAFGALDDASLEYAYFGSNVDDLIQLVPSSVNVFVPMNVSSATVRGHEVSARGRLWSRLDLSANYTHQDAFDTGDDVHHGKRLPGRPADETYARVELAWSHERPLPLGAVAARLWPGRLFYDVDLIGDDFLDLANHTKIASRALHGVGVELELPLAGVRMAFEVKNLTDDRTEDALGFPLPGRSMFVTLSYGFQARERH